MVLSGKRGTREKAKEETVRKGQSTGIDARHSGGSFRAQQLGSPYTSWGVEN